MKTKALRPEDRGRKVFARLIVPLASEVYGPPSLPWPDDPEALVHDTRVASRRLVEGLELVSPALPASTVRKLRRDAKRLRRALGARREADVMRADFERLLARTQLPPSTGAELLDALVESGQRGLDAARERFHPRRLGKMYARVRDAESEFSKKESLRSVAGPHLYRRATEPEHRLEGLADPDAVSAHHALRIDMKRLRYTLETLTAVYPEAFEGRDPLPTCKKVQDAFGVLQDADDLRRFLEREDLARRLDETALDVLRDLALEEMEDRRRKAEEIGEALVPDLLALARRAAGRIGALERA